MAESSQRWLPGVAVRTTCLLLLLMLISVASIAPATAQSADRRARQRAAKFGAGPGEVITPPDRSERWRDELRVGEPAPEITLPLASGAEDAKAMAERGKRNASRKGKGSGAEGDSPRTVSLKELRAKKPVVLIFGSVTCPPFRSALEGIDEVHRDFRDRAEFLFVYIREAHPDSVLSLSGANSQLSLVKIPQHTTLEGRTEAAAACGRTLQLGMPIAVDGIDNKVGRAYAGWPNRMVVVGTDGRVLFASDPSPRGTNAARLRAWLAENLPEAAR
jgi:hypothetical protein